MALARYTIRRYADPHDGVVYPANVFDFRLRGDQSPLGSCPKNRKKETKLKMRENWRKEIKTFTDDQKKLFH